MSVDRSPARQSISRKQSNYRHQSSPRKDCSAFQTRTCRGRLLIFVENEVDRLSWLGHDIDLHLWALGHLALDSRVCLQDADSCVCHFGQSKLLTCYTELASVPFFSQEVNSKSLPIQMRGPPLNGMSVFLIRTAR